MKIDRTLQRQILETLRDVYPHRDRRTLFEGIEDGSKEDERIVANLMYLEEHALVESGLQFSLSGSAVYSGARITAAGLDFLEDDGGLTAILGTVTVKLHADTIKDLMLAKIEASPAPPAEKSLLKKAIASMSAEALKEVTKKLVTTGLDSAPDAVAFIKGLIG